MRRPHHLARTLLVSVCCVLLPASAFAQGTELSDEARAHFDAGTRAFDTGDLETAVSEFRTAYAITPHPDLQYNIYSTLERLGELAAAADALERYLAEATLDAERRATMNVRLGRLRERVAAQADPDETDSMREDDARDQPATPFEPTEPNIQVVGPGVPGLIMLAAGGVLLINFAVFAGLSVAEDSNLDGSCGVRCTSEEVSTLQAFNIVADVSWVTGGALAIAGLVLAFVLPETRDMSVLSVVPVGMPGGAGVAARGSF